MPSLVEVYAYQPLNERSSLAGADQLKYSGRVYLAAGKSGWLKELLDSWDVSPILLSIQAFQEHVVSYLGSLHQDYSMSDLA